MGEVGFLAAMVRACLGLESGHRTNQPNKNDCPVTVDRDFGERPTSNISMFGEN